MRHQRFIFLMLSFSFLSVNGQEQTILRDHPFFYYSSFLNYSTNNADSALFYVRKLASKSDYSQMLEDLLHNTFAQAFMKRPEKDDQDSEEKSKRKMALEIAQSILSAIISDSNRNLVKAAQPIYFWTQIQQNANDDKKLNELVSQFMRTQLSIDDLYTNRIGKYALLIHQVIAEKNICRQNQMIF